MPWIDPIVEETRQARNEYAASLDYDLKKMYQDLKKKEEQSGCKVVSFPSKTRAAIRATMVCGNTKLTMEHETA